MKSLSKLDGLLRIREEVLLYAMSKTSMSERQVLDEIYLSIYSRLSKPRDIKFNARGWNTQKANFQIGECKLYLSISVSKWDFIAVKVSIPKYNKDRIICLNTIKAQAEEIVNSKIEESLTG